MGILKKPLVIIVIKKLDKVIKKIFRSLYKSKPLCYNSRMENFARDFSIYKHGIISQKKSDVPASVRASRFHGKKRGRIITFSYASRRRLRQTLLCYSMPDSKQVSCTLTFATKRFISDDEFRRLWLYFNIYFRRDEYLKHCSFIWRVELQENSHPHIHSLLYIPNSLDSREVCLRISDIWWNLHGHFSLNCDKTFDSFNLYACEFQLCEDSGKIYKYMSDHMSKHKKNQLGWQGRQWGITNRKLLSANVPLFEFSDDSPLEQKEDIYDDALSEDEQYSAMSHNLQNVNRKILLDKLKIRALRYVRRVLCFRESSSCVFGSKIHRCKKFPKVVFLRPETSKKLRDWLLDEEFEIMLA